MGRPGSERGERNKCPEHTALLKINQSQLKILTFWNAFIKSSAKKVTAGLASVTALHVEW